MRKHILPTLLILALAGGLAVAQTITKALQLSADTTGAFSVDTNNGVYFPGHLLTPLGGRPGPTVSGTGTPTVSGTDLSGTITMGTSATTATVVFGTTFISVPACLVSWPSVLAAETYVNATTSIAITQTATSGNKITYWCASQG